MKFKATISNARRPDGWIEIYDLGRVRLARATRMIQRKVNRFNENHGPRKQRTLISVKRRRGRQARIEEARIRQYRTPPTAAVGRVFGVPDEEE